MQSIGSLKIIIPLGSVANRGTCGTKAFSLDRLTERGFAVPDGWCLRSDAYRAHLWTSGVRSLARSKPNSEERDTLRRAIIKTDLLPEISSAIEAAYLSLGDDVMVAVRHSAYDEAVAGTAYETVLGVRGLQELVDAIKSVWASVWSERASVFRAQPQERYEPVMGVVVQRMIPARTSGIATTANVSRGNPNEVVIQSTLGVSTGGEELDRAVVDLRGFNITEKTTARKYSIVGLGSKGLEEKPASPDAADAHSLTEDRIKELAEIALWAEKAVSSPGSRTVEQIVQWAFDGEQFWILGAKPAERLLQHAPVPWHDLKEERFLWQLLHQEPVPKLAQDLVVGHMENPPTLPSNRKAASIKCCIGRMYSRSFSVEKIPGMMSSLLDVMAGGRLYRKWKSAATDIVKESRNDLAQPIADLSDDALTAVLRSAAKRAKRSAAWYYTISYPALRFNALLREMLRSVDVEPGVPPRLLSGHDRSRYERDLVLQRFAAYVWQAQILDEESELLEEMPGDIAKTFGYAFRAAADAYDLSRWQSWVEDLSPIAGLSSALARGPLVDAQWAHERAEAISEAVETMVCDAMAASRSAFKLPFSRAKFHLLLSRARDWAGALTEREHVHALALSALRVFVVEFGQRLEKAGVLVSPEDMFHLSLRELSSLRIEIPEEEQRILHQTLAERKHELWIESRMIPPERLPRDIGVPEDGSEQSARSARMLIGVPAGPGETSGAARVVRSIKDASALVPGEILVVDEISPAWTPLLAIAGGIVTAGDAGLRHYPSPARDYGIPCVAAVSGATSVIQTGCTVFVDGSAGKVEVVRRRHQAKK